MERTNIQKTCLSFIDLYEITNFKKQIQLVLKIQN
jgi:hypothetical protein